MLNKYRQNFVLFIFFIDIGLTCLSWLFSYSFRFEFDILPVKHGIPKEMPYLQSLFLIVPIWTISLIMTSIYRNENNEGFFKEGIKIIRSCLIAFVIAIVILFFLKKETQLSRLFLITFLVFNITFLLLFRYLLKTILRFFHSKGHCLHKVLILGGGKIAEDLCQKIKSEFWIGYKVIGFLENTTNVSFMLGDIPRLGKLDDLEKVLFEQKVKTIFITIDTKKNEILKKILNKLSKHSINVKIIPNMFQYDLLLHMQMEDMDGFPVLSLVDSPMVGFNQVVKRSFDILFSLFFIILFSSLFLLIAVLIKCTSSGPIFYKQKRISIDGRTFNIYKFRSMPTDIENYTGPKWSKKDDKRATKIGAILRKTSLDELPQFFNVLWGTMSVVGPRPERPVFVENFRHKIPNYMLRHKMKAGITGWAQVNGYRGDTSLKKRIEYDIFYINNWSLILDIKIIWMTLYRGFVDKNAY